MTTTIGFIVNDKDKEKIVSALNDKDVSAPCPRCSSLKFQVVGQSTLYIEGKKIMPTALIACTKCGFIAMHALGILDIAPML